MWAKTLGFEIIEQEFFKQKAIIELSPQWLNRHFKLKPDA